MRSRYAGFALGLGSYLVDTLASGHPDHEAPRDALVGQLTLVRRAQRFLGLRIVDAPSAEPDRGEVLFYARIFERGVDCSFAELSSFMRESGSWRYVSGVLLTRDVLPCAPEELTRDAFDVALLAHHRPERRRE